MCLSLCVLLSVMSSKSIYVISDDKHPSRTLYGYSTFFLSICWMVAFEKCHVLAAVSDAAVDFKVQIPLETVVSFALSTQIWYW